MVPVGAREKRPVGPECHSERPVDWRCSEDRYRPARPKPYEREVRVVARPRRAIVGDVQRIAVCNQPGERADVWLKGVEHNAPGGVDSYDTGIMGVSSVREDALVGR